jgi:hypothetical protein
VTSADSLGEHDRLDAVAHAELGEHALDVRLHRRLAEDQRRAHLEGS